MSGPKAHRSGPPIANGRVAESGLFSYMKTHCATSRIIQLDDAVLFVFGMAGARRQRQTECGKPLRSTAVTLDPMRCADCDASFVFSAVHPKLFADRARQPFRVAGCPRRARRRNRVPMSRSFGRGKASGSASVRLDGAYLSYACYFADCYAYRTLGSKVSMRSDYYPSWMPGTNRGVCDDRAALTRAQDKR